MPGTSFPARGECGLFQISTEGLERRDRFGFGQQRQRQASLARHNGGSRNASSDGLHAMLTDDKLLVTIVSARSLR